MPVRQTPDWRGLGGLTLAHIANDINQSALPACLPFLIPARHLSLGGAALLILAMNLSSSLVQPIVGHLADRRSLGWILPTSLLLSGLGTASVGLMPSFPAMLVVCVLAGVGSAAFHPEASRRANLLSGPVRASGMSWFTLGGYLGFALGPVLVTPCLLAFGIRGTACLALPALASALGAAYELARCPGGSSGEPLPGCGQDDWNAFGWLSLVVGLRAVAFFGAVTFLPLFFMRVMHTSAAQGNSALTWMLLAGAVGTLVGGRLGDRLSRPAVISASLALMALMALLIALCAALQAPLLASGISFCLGLSISLSASVMVVLGQDYLPNHLGVASGVTLGLAVSAGGLGVPLLGVMGDRWGLAWVFGAIAGVGLTAWLTSLRLPQPMAQIAEGRSYQAAQGTESVVRPGVWVKFDQSVNQITNFDVTHSQAEPSKLSAGATCTKYSSKGASHDSQPDLDTNFMERPDPQKDRGPLHNGRTPTASAFA